jgi:uncharacterized protein YndB with AHSA1/START domain
LVPINVFQSVENVMTDLLQADGEIIDARTVRFQRLLPGPIERVWAYLTEAEKRATWFAGGEIEPRVGGKRTLHFRHADLMQPGETAPEKYRQVVDGFASNGRVTRYEPPRGLAFTWGKEGAESEVVFELAPQGDKVLLTLTHRKIVSREDMVNFSGGWHLHLLVLEHVLAGTKPPRFWDTHAQLDAKYQRMIP